MAAFNALPKPLDYKSANEFIRRWRGSQPPLPLVLEFASASGKSGAFQLKDRDWFTLLGHFWSSFDNVNPYIDALMETAFFEVCDRRYFDYSLGLSPREIRARNNRREACIAAMMDAGERAAYNALPGELTLYRGCYQDSRMGLSWTLDRNTAEHFLARGDDDTALLLTAIASKRDIVALKQGEQGQEVITWNPRIVSEEILDAGVLA